MGSMYTLGEDPKKRTQCTYSKYYTCEDLKLQLGSTYAKSIGD